MKRYYIVNASIFDLAKAMSELNEAAEMGYQVISTVATADWIIWTMEIKK